MVEVGRGDRLAEISLGWPVPGDDHVDSAPLAILEDILGTTGQRLAEEIKDRRAMATSVDVGYLAFSDAGALMLEATTQPDRADAVVELLLNEIRRLRDGDVSEQDVRASLRAIAGRRSLAEEPNQRQTSRAQAEVSGMLESWDEYMARLRVVTPADVQRVARRYLDLQNYTLVIVRA
jgi:zinc protease